VPDDLRNQLGIGMANRIYVAYRSQLESERWQRLYNFGARPQRLLWASTGTKDPAVSDLLYVNALAAPLTVNTMPEATLKAAAQNVDVGPSLFIGKGEGVLARFADSGIDIDILADQLQDDAAKLFVQSWNELMDVIASKSAELKKAS
jgi:transaldolase